MSDIKSLLTELRREEEGTERAILWRWSRWSTTFAVVVALILVASVVMVVRTPIATTDRVAVRLATAESVDWEVAGSGVVVEASGYIVPRRRATVSARTTGKVQDISIEEGQHVEKGQVIARLDDTVLRGDVRRAMAEVELAEARLRAADVALGTARAVFHRQREQFERQIISPQSFDEAKAAFDAVQAEVEVANGSLQVAKSSLGIARSNVDEAIVRAPFAGVVTEKAAQVGEIVSPVSAGGGFTRTGICTIVDMSSLEVDVDVSEKFISRIRVGQSSEVVLNAYPGWTIAAHVIAVIPTADRASATVKVRVGLDESDARILPNMGGRVSFRGGTSSSVRRVIVVPRDAVIVSNNDVGTVYEVTGQGTVVERRVRVGQTLPDGRIAVLDGIEEGTVLAAGDLSRLEDQASVRVTS